MVTLGEAGEGYVAVVELVAVKELEPFDFRWPENIESFERWWSFDAYRRRAIFRRPWHWSREVYGRTRVQTVTWIAGEIPVEGGEADD